MGQANTLPTEHKDCQQNKTRYHSSRVHRTTSQSDVMQENNSSQLTLDRFVQHHPHPASIMAGMKSNKRFRKPD
jgi:hypothetical protein